MNVTVQYGEHFEDLLIPLNGTVLDVKKQLSGIFDIDADLIYLRFNNKYLLEKYDMSKYQIKDNSKLIMAATITIMIEYMEEMIPVEVLSDATVTDLRKQISITDGMEGLNDYGLMFEGVDLEDQEKICKYHIKHKSVVTIMYKMRLMIESCGQDYEIKVIPNADIADVRRKLSEIIKINKNNIILRLDSIYLLDDKRLTKYKMKNDSVVTVRIQMRVFVDYCGECHEIETSSENTVDNIKTQMSMKTGIGIRLIQLFFNGQEMRNEDLLGQFGIRERLELVMRVKIAIVVQFFDKDYKIETFSDETILNSKSKICEEFKTNMSETTLYLNNKLINDDTMLKDYQIKDNSRLTMRATIKVFIEFCNQKDNFRVYSDATVDEVKRHLKKEYKLRKEQIHLWSMEKSVEKHEEKIYKYDIKDNSVIKMREKIKVKVIFHKREYNFELFSDEKVFDLFDQLSKKVKVDRNVIQLIQSNIYLLNDKYLYQYRLRDSTLFMITKMRISVTFRGEKYQIENFSSTTVHQLKKQLKEECKFEYRNIHLKESGREMKDEDELGMYGIDALEVSIWKYSFHIFLKDYEKVFVINVSSQDSVGELKAIFIEKSHFKSKNHFHFFFDGDVLENDKKLEFYDMEDGDTVLVMSCLTGG